MPDASALTKLAKGRAIVVRRAPYFAAMLYGLIPVEAPGCKTLFVTPGLVMGYDPDFINKLTEEEVAGCYAHELNHPLRQTHKRFAGMEGSHEIKNIGADIPINEDLRTMGFTLPQGVSYPETYGFPKGLTTEAYVELLNRLKEKDKLPDRGPPGLGSGQCGGVAGNPVDQDLEDQLDKEYGRSQADIKGKQRQTGEAIKKHNAQGRGVFGSDMTEAIEAMSGPAKVPWHKALRHALNSLSAQVSQGATDYSMSRPSNRSFARDDGIISPGLVGYEPNVLVCLDTSGSMQALQLGTAFREIVGAIKALGLSHVQFMEADADVACKPRRVSIQDLRTVEIHGRGGTDFRPAIQYAEKMKPKPDILIYFTDGDGFADGAPPRGINVVWCIVPSYNRSPPAPWGKVIYVDDIEKESDD